MPMVSYEGGQHVLPFGYGDRNIPEQDDFMDFMDAFQASPQMGAIYAEQFAQWRAVGGHTPSLWMDVGPWSFWGYWGAKEYVTQTRAESPRWDAFCDFLEFEQGVRSGQEPLGSKPDWQTQNLRGEVGIVFDETVVANGGEGSRVVSLLGGRLPPGLALTDLGNGQGRVVGTPTAPGRFVAIFRIRDADGDVDDEFFNIEIDPSGFSGHQLVAFRGADLPASMLANGTPNGRYDPMRATQSVVIGGASAMCVPFSFDDALFGAEFVGTESLLATSPLNMYGGWCLTALEGATRAGAPELSSWTGLRNGGFTAWTGDLQGPSSLDALLLWKREQFTSSGATFGFEVGRDTLQVDLTSVIGDGNNLLRFVVVDSRSGDLRWFVSEAAWTRAQLGDGIFRLDGWAGSSAIGHRWAEVPAPTATSLRLPETGLVFQAESFSDVRAVGLSYRGTRWRWHYAFGFSRFFALGESTP
jgi:hypothetical protein